MTLYRQLTLSIALLLVTGFLGSVIISTENLRTFLLTQLESHAQDTATSLGLSLSPPMQVRDMTIITSMVDAVFDRGYYQQIDITSLNGETLLSRSNQTGNRDVPAWFTELVDLQPPAAEALIMSGWQQAGKVHVASHTGHAYNELWSNTVDTFRLFLALAIVIIVTGLIAVNILLRPLRLLESQADAICNASYPLQKKLPRTRELRRVVTAMNRMSGKIGIIFAEQSALTESLRVQAYKDPVTGLGNRRYFDRQLETLLGSREEPSTGALLLLELHGLSEINLSAGYPAGDQYLQAAANLISKRIKRLDSCFAARISGAGYGIVAVGLDREGAESLAEDLCHELLQLHTDGLESNENIIVHIGVTLWKQQDVLHDLLAEADSSLRAAQSTGKNSWKHFTPSSGTQKPIYGSGHWRTILQHAINTENITLCTQPVFHTGSKSIILPHHEILLRIPDHAGNPITAGLFMPMAERFGLASDFDKLAVRKLLTHMESEHNTQPAYAINLSSGSLHNPVFIQWLCRRLESASENAGRILIEFPEYGALINIQDTRNLIERLDSLGCQCGIDHFGQGFHSFGYLRNIKVGYLKPDGSYTRDIDKDEDNQFLIRALTEAAHSVDIAVIAQAVETSAERDTLTAMYLDGIQGFLTGSPQPLQT
ncbi:MAG: EAL domain-containing protein [Pseudomonadota bacterium]